MKEFELAVGGYGPIRLGHVEPRRVGESEQSGVGPSRKDRPKRPQEAGSAQDQSELEAGQRRDDQRHPMWLWSAKGKGPDSAG